MNNLRPDEALFSNEVLLNDVELPIAIFKFENGFFSYVKVTAAYKEELKYLGHEELEESERAINNRNSGVYDNFVEYVNICLNSRKPETKDLIIDGNYCSIRMRCEKSPDNENAVICKAFFMNLSKLGHENNERDTALRNLYSFYDHINLFDIKNHKIKRLYTNDSQYIVEAKDNDPVVYLQEYSEKYIHPSEKEKYRKNFSLENIEKKFKSTRKNFILAYFRTKNVTGEYEWKAYILLKTSDKQNEVLYSCVRSVDLTTEHVLIRDNYVELLNELPVAYSVFEVKADDNGKIEDVTCVFASKLTSELMGIPVDEQIGKSVMKMIKLHEGWADEMYRAAYKQERVSAVQYIPTNKKWVNIILDKAAQKGRCAAILEDVTKEQLTTQRLGREWRTDDLIITCAKYLHCGLPYEEAIGRVVRLVGESIHARRVYIIEAEEDDTFSVTFEWCREANDSIKERFKKLERSNMLNWEQEFIGAFSVIINDVESIKYTHAHMYKILKEYDVHSLVEIPIMDEGQLVGYFGAIDYGEIDALDARQLLETLSYFLAAEIVRKKLLQELEKKSIYDTLCNVKNRNAMDIIVKRLTRKNLSLGVLYADANGLKRINDTMGHEAGDALLKKMSRMMSECFGKENVYRAGGDEFIVINPKISEEEFLEKCDKLKANFENEKGIAVALGSSWTLDSSGIVEVMREADKVMYEDKANYYRKNNRRRSRD